MSVHAHSQPRFSTYLAGHRTDPAARRRLIVAAIASTVTVAVAGAFGWTADKLGIQPVDAPTAHQAIMLEVGPPPPPPANPPPQPSGGAASDESPPDDAPRQPTPVRRAAPASDDADDSAVDLEKPATGVPGPTGVPSGPTGVPGIPGLGDGPGVPGSFGPPCPTCKRKPPTPRNDGARGPVTKPVSVVKANAIFTPDPDQKALSRTKTGLMRPQGKSTTKVSFCVTTKGAVSDVKTAKRYPGDPEVDRICRDAVKKWRFRPLLVGGRAHKTCTTTTFVIEFE